MNFCPKCGHELGVGRFCTNCGAPVPGRHPSAATPAGGSDTPASDLTVVRPSSPPAGPPVTPAPGSPPPTARYPLYADSPLGPEPALPPAMVPGTAPGSAQMPPSSYPPAPRRRGWILVVVAVVLALLVVAGGVTAYALINQDDKGTGASATKSTDTGPTTTTSTATSPTTSTGSTGGDLTGDVQRIEVPGTARPSTDLSGRPVTFGWANMVDGDPQTAWRVGGDASGQSLTIHLDQPVTLTTVGLINGYSKAYPGYDGYRLNRRILGVQWTFDDGSTVDQPLLQHKGMQTIPVDGVKTSTITLTITSTTPPGKGPDGKDFTAISELALQGSVG